MYPIIYEHYTEGTAHCDSNSSIASVSLYMILDFSSCLIHYTVFHLKYSFSLLLLHFLFHSHYYSEQSTLPVLSVVWLKSVLISSLVGLGRNLAYRILGMLMFCPVFLGFHGKIMCFSSTDSVDVT